MVLMEFDEDRRSTAGAMKEAKKQIRDEARARREHFRDVVAGTAADRTGVSPEDQGRA